MLIYISGNSPVKNRICIPTTSGRQYHQHLVPIIVLRTADLHFESRPRISSGSCRSIDYGAPRIIFRDLPNCTPKTSPRLLSITPPFKSSLLPCEIDVHRQMTLSGETIAYSSSPTSLSARMYRNISFSLVSISKCKFCFRPNPAISKFNLITTVYELLYDSSRCETALHLRFV